MNHYGDHIENAGPAVKGLSLTTDGVGRRGLPLTLGMGRLPMGTPAPDGSYHHACQQLHGGYVALIKGIGRGGKDLKYTQGPAEMPQRMMCPDTPRRARCERR